MFHLNYTKSHCLTIEEDPAGTKSGGSGGSAAAVVPCLRGLFCGTNLWELVVP